MSGAELWLLIRMWLVANDHFLRQPFLVIVVVLIGAFLFGAWRSLGITWLFWCEFPVRQGIVGLAVGLLGSIVLFIGHAIDQQSFLWDSRLLQDWKRFEDKWSLDAQSLLVYDASIMTVVFALSLATYLAQVVVRYLTPVEKRTKRTINHHWPLLLGLTIGLGVGLAIAWFPAYFADPRETDAGHVVEQEIVWLLIVVPIVYVILGLIPPRVVSPAVSLCALLAVLVIAYGCLHLLLISVLRAFITDVTKVQGAVGLVNTFLIMLIIILLYMVGRDRYRIKFQELREYYVPLGTGTDPEVGLINLNVDRPRPASAPVLLSPLLHEKPSSGEVKWGSKRPLVLVAASGGGITAAAWTIAVLNALEKRLPSFPDHVRLVTGASGGMVGAGYYVSTLVRPDARSLGTAHRVRGSELKPILTHGDMYDRVADDFLSDVTSHLVFNDLLRLVVNRPWASDRGQALERAWARYLEGGLDVPLASLAKGEEDGWRPSLVFAPMLVEDGRRLLISNLDLSRLGVISAQGAFADGGAKSADSKFRLAAEFYKLFPKATNFTVATAARMNASFPLISPVGVLPTEPRRRVVDAGYYDNYGLNLAASWIAHNIEWLTRTETPIALVEIRAYPLKDSLEQFEVDGSNSFTRGLEWASSPLAGLLAARQAAMTFRNEEQIERIFETFEYSGTERLLSRFIFECPVNSPLSWYLTTTQRDDIRDGVEAQTIVPHLNSFEAWFKRSAERPPRIPIEPLLAAVDGIARDRREYDLLVPYYLTMNGSPIDHSSAIAVLRLKLKTKGLSQVGIKKLPTGRQYRFERI